MLNFSRQAHNGNETFAWHFLEFFEFLSLTFLGRNIDMAGSCRTHDLNLGNFGTLKKFWGLKNFVGIFFRDRFTRKLLAFFHTPAHTEGVWKMPSHNHLAKFCVLNDPGFFLWMLLY